MFQAQVIAQAKMERHEKIHSHLGNAGLSVRLKSCIHGTHVRAAGGGP